MFSGSSSSTVIHAILSDLIGRHKSKMAAVNPEVLISSLVHACDGNAIHRAKPEVSIF